MECLSNRLALSSIIETASHFYRNNFFFQFSLYKQNKIADHICMNILTKQFSTLLQNTNKNLKKQIALDIMNNMTEYQDFIPYILKNVYKMIVSTNIDDRAAGCIILRGVKRGFIDVRYESDNDRMSNTRVYLEPKNDDEVQCVKHSDKDTTMHKSGDTHLRISSDTTLQKSGDTTLHKSSDTDLHKNSDTNLHKVNANENDIIYNTHEHNLYDTFLPDLDKSLFLGVTGKEYNTETLSIQEMKKEVSKHAGIDDRFVKVELVNESDFSKREILAMRRREKMKKKVKEEEAVVEKSIENVPDFFKFLYEDLMHKEWHRRDGAFGAFIEILKVEEEEIEDDIDETEPIEGAEVQAGADEQAGVDAKECGSKIDSGSEIEDGAKIECGSKTERGAKIECRAKIEDEKNTRSIAGGSQIAAVTSMEEPNRRTSIQPGNSENDLPHSNNIDMSGDDSVSNRIDKELASNVVNNSAMNDYYKNPNVIIFYVPKNLIHKCMQVIYSDKLVDFVCDQISMPVREKVAKLIQILYKSSKEAQKDATKNVIDRNKIMNTLVNFIKNSDWQIQCGAIFCIKNITWQIPDYSNYYQVIISDILCNLLLSKDEDIKNFCAEVLCYLPISNYESVLQNCWKSIEDSNEIAIGKKNILKLITKIYTEEGAKRKYNTSHYESSSKTDIKSALQPTTTHNLQDAKQITCDTIPIDFSKALLINKEAPLFSMYKNLQKLVYCFRSPLFDVKLSVLEMVSKVYNFMTEKEKLFILRCVIENVLLENNEEIQERSVAMFEYILSDNIKYLNTIKHYLEVISNNLEEEYKIEDFVWKGEELMYSKSGIKLLGRNEVLNGKIKYLNVIKKRLLSDIRDNRHAACDANGEDYTNAANGADSSAQNLDFCINNNIESGIESKNIYKIIYNCILLEVRVSLELSLFFSDKVYSEILKKEKDCNYNSIYPLFNNYYIDYLRLKIFVTNFEIEDIKKLYENEENEEYLEVISKIIIQQCNKQKDTLNSSKHVRTLKIIDPVYVIYDIITKEDIIISNSSVNLTQATKKEIGIDFDINSFFNTTIKKKCYASVFFKEYKIKENDKFHRFVKEDKKRIKFFSEVLKQMVNNKKETGKCETGKCETEKCETGKCETGKCEIEKCEIEKCEIEKCETGKCETGKCYPNDLKEYDFIFYEAIKNCENSTEFNIEIIKIFILYDKFYEEYLIRFLMNNFNVKLLKEVFEFIKPSFYFLFPRILLKIINNSGHKNNASKNESVVCNSKNDSAVGKNESVNESVCKSKSKNELEISKGCSETQDSSNSVMASYCFSCIVPYLSLKRISKNITSDLKELIKMRCKEIKELFDIKKEYKIECETSVKLRDYQKKGLAWMSFMKEMGVNGILADDMGLGKTIMVLSFLSNEIYKLARYNNLGCDNNTVNGTTLALSKPDNTVSANGVALENSNSYNTTVPVNGTALDDNDAVNVTSLQLLILTPSSLTGHWEDEIKKKYPNLKSSLYTKKNPVKDTITIISFDLFRNEYLSFINTHYFYVIIDEGHILKNRNTILYSRILLLKSSHKLILTGTPIHNSVEDIFSLFNFLMPNYLGYEKDFISNYVKIINQARESKATERDIEKSEKKIKELHKKVLPFVMRRLKSEVLKDLPPKIVTDIIIEMSEDERKAYESIQEGEERDENKDVMHDIGNVSYKDLGKSGFKKMGELLKVCSHKKYIKNVYIKNVYNFAEESKKYKYDKEESRINTVDNQSDLSSKVKALIEIINLSGGENMKNKILIFCQYKTTIDYLVKDLKGINYLKYLRIDGSIKSELRNKIAQDFNEGDYHLMFLTTQVGGLGLNLTGADTVIMYEHDWNPFNDLQAMDRAHRIGQKNTVNVYRLITKNTIEERIMNLQNFKVYVAGSIVTQQNNETGSMEIGDVFERFEKKD